MGVTATVNLDLNFPDDANVAQRIIAGENLAAEFVLAEAVDRSPWDQGTLAQSGAVENAISPEEGAGVTFDTPYAERLHEHPEYNFSTDSNPNAQGKWLENAAMENRDKVGQIIAKKVADG